MASLRFPGRRPVSRLMIPDDLMLRAPRVAVVAEAAASD